MRRKTCPDSSLHHVSGFCGFLALCVAASANAKVVVLNEAHLAKLREHNQKYCEVIYKIIYMEGFESLTHGLGNVSSPNF
jgi:hypothetical protein